MGKARGCLQLLRAMVGRWRARRAARRRPFTNDSRFFHENRSPTLLIAFIRPSATLLIVRGACPTPFSNGAPFLPHTDSGQIFLLRRRRRRKLSTLDETDLEITIDAFHSGAEARTRPVSNQTKRRPRQFCITRRGSLSFQVSRELTLPEERIEDTSSRYRELLRFSVSRSFLFLSSPFFSLSFLFSYRYGIRYRIPFVRVVYHYKRYTGERVKNV